MPWKELPVTSSPLSVLQAAADASNSMAIAYSCPMQNP